jgi:multicomponent Na+:H+ antiporter subunit D
VYRFLTYELVLGKVDLLSTCFGYVFVIAALLGTVYALHVKEEGQHIAAFFYVGSTLGVTFAGDLISLFIFWEVMAVSSVFLIWYRKGQRALDAGFRYLMVHLFGGTLLLAGIVMHVAGTGSIEFTRIGGQGLSSYFILLGFLINAAVPPFHAWLSDAYPEATVTGSVFLSAFTTKCAVYVLLRGFPGMELLVWMGAIMALYGVVYAFLENDIRRLLAYHIISQVGFMVCGVGLGTEMSMNGSTVHAFCVILSKALLFMGAGAVIEVTGRAKLTELGGRNLFRKMPVCFGFYMIGAFSISAVPLFSGFVSKTMIVFAAGEVHRPVIHLLLHFASIGTFLSIGLKLPYGTWFGRSRKGEEAEEIAVKEPPLNMLVAMGMTAFLCIFTGVYPKVLYDILPHSVGFRPYTVYSVSGTMQLLMFAAIAFWFFLDKLGGESTISVDTDWIYRKGAYYFQRSCFRFAEGRQRALSRVAAMVRGTIALSSNPVYVFTSLILRRRTVLVPYDADSYRQAIGTGVVFFLVLFSFFCIVFFLSVP